MSFIILNPQGFAASCGMLKGNISKSSIFSLDMNPFFNFEENTSKIQYTGAEFLLNLEINPTNDFYLSFGLGDFLTSDKENQIYFDINLKLNY